MKRKFFVLIGSAAIVAAVAFNFSVSLCSEYLSDISLTNVEALAQSEDCWTVGECCSSDGYYEWCGVCFGLYMQGC